MGIDVGSKKGGLNCTINVTPMADVMLVLLIIIMLIAPLLQKGIDVTLPEASNPADKPEVDAQTVLGVDKDGRFFVDQQPVAGSRAAGSGPGRTGPESWSGSSSSRLIPTPRMAP